MPEVVDLMDKASEEIQKDGKLIMNDKFMFGIFKKIAEQVKPFKQYMAYMFKNKKSSPIGSFKEEEKVTPWDMLRMDLMYPTRRDIIQSFTMTVELAVHAAIIFRKEFRDDKQATTKY